MKQIDLEPHHYRKKIDGRWFMVADRKLARLYFFAMLGVLAFVFVNKDALTLGTLFGGAAMPGFVAGIMFALWLRGDH